MRNKDIHLTEKIIKTPKSVQDTIPIYRIARDGIFELEKKRGLHTFDKMYLFEDINFSSKDIVDKKQSLDKYKDLLNSLNVPYKIIIANQYINNEHLKKNVLRTASASKYASLAKDFNDLILDLIKNKTGAVTKSRYFILTCQAENFTEARDFFTNMEKMLTSRFEDLGSVLLPMDVNDRLYALHCFYRLGDEENFHIDWDKYVDLKRDFRNDIINTAIVEHKNHIILDEDRVECTLFSKDFKHHTSGDFINSVTDLPFPMIFTMDVDPIDNSVARDRVMKKHMAIERSINKEQEMKNERGYFSTGITYDKRIQLEETEDLLNGLSSHDERLSYVGITVVVQAESLRELKERKQRIIAAANNTVELAPHIYNQLDALNTTLPIGCRFVDTMRSMTSMSLCKFTPFNSQEIYFPGAICYGINKKTGNLILADRKSLKNANGNGLYFGSTGFGKSMQLKYEAGQVLAFYKDDVIIVDPMSEYRDIAEAWHGHYINLSKSDEDSFHVNPLHIPEGITKDMRTTFVTDKCEFAYAICEQALRPTIINKHHLGIIDNALRSLYADIFEKYKQRIGKNVLSPTLRDLRQRIHELYQGDADAQMLYDCLEVFTDGSLNIFADQQSRSEDNRLKVYAFGDIGKQMRSMAMLVMIESINSQIKYNQKEGKATWVYIDEIHELWGEEHSLNSITRLWREVRKRGGICTGISQNIVDAIQNRSTKTMVSNSEFILFLSQGAPDREVVSELFNVSDKQLDMITDSPKGTGLIKFGEKIVGFDNQLPHDSNLYKLFNTNFFERNGG